LIESHWNKSIIFIFYSTNLLTVVVEDGSLPQNKCLTYILKYELVFITEGCYLFLKIIENLFSRGHICAFSTETFAMGVIMPACTVVFNGITHDGHLILPEE